MFVLSGSWSYISILNWTTISMCFVLVLLIYRKLWPDVYERTWTYFKFEKKWVFPALFLLGLLLYRESMVLPFGHLVAVIPEFPFWAQAYYYIGFWHLRSYVFYGFMIFYLWKKYDSVLPALAVSWFWLAIIEFTFIPQHLLWGGFIMPINWYMPFLAISILFVIERKRFKVPRISWLIFAAGILIELAMIPFVGFAFTRYDAGLGYFVPNESMLDIFRIGPFLFDLANHGLKVVFTLGALFVTLRKRPKK